MIVYCNNGAGNAPQTYEAWYGYSSLPKLKANSTPVRQLIWSNGTSSVGPYWVSQGADGWRFDVGGDVDPGLTNDPSNDYWEGFRSAVRAVDSQTLTLGEEWGDSSAWLLGNEWDSVMNYRFRSALLSWLATGCSGNGCSGGVFQENDSNNASSSGADQHDQPVPVQRAAALYRRGLPADGAAGDDEPGRLARHQSGALPAQEGQQRQRQRGRAAHEGMVAVLLHLSGRTHPLLRRRDRLEPRWRLGWQHLAGRPLQPRPLPLARCQRQQLQRRCRPCRSSPARWPASTGAIPRFRMATCSTA